MPAAVKVWSPGASAVEVEPSPKSHRTVTASPSGSAAEPAKATVPPASTETSPAGWVMTPSGGALAALTVTVRESGVGSARPRSSVAVRVTV